MNNSVISRVASLLNVGEWQVEAVLKLNTDGCTIPFISRYRKEATGNLDEVAVKDIIDTNQSIEEIDKRKEFILNAILQLGKLSPELKSRIDNASDLTELEDIYMPFKPKKQTRAEMARKKGLEPLAKIIMAQNVSDVDNVARKFLNKEVADSDAAVSGALDIIAEWVSESEAARNQLRNLFSKSAVISASVVKGKDEDGAKYNNYFNFSKPLKYVGSHQLLAIRRAENEGILRVSIDVDSDEALSRLGRIFIKSSSASRSLIEKAVKDSYKRLLKPSIENEFAASSKAKADESAIATFSDNLRQLLMAAPLIGKRILAIDPGYRTGCKIVCLDENGALLYNDSIFPNPPQKAVSDSMKKLSRLAETYKIDAISLGNGTASRETEDFLTKISFPRKVQVYVVNESGASIYSASPLARKEFPDKDVTVRGAVSIGRRLLDPLAELVKIDARSIGVGQYQHDVDQNRLKDALDFVVDMCVNRVGVNVNTASEELLSHLAGIGPSLA
ncbi:MAG: helix-hairpin-helix domain-containing protein, partial [Muribaculaceae bacterium]|nr:helix-hairpin-helix domain-containing protein [Muribaculaceae bacterium]